MSCKPTDFTVFALILQFSRSQRTGQSDRDLSPAPSLCGGLQPLLSCLATARLFLLLLFPEGNVFPAWHCSDEPPSFPLRNHLSPLSHPALRVGPAVRSPRSATEEVGRWHGSTQQRGGPRDLSHSCDTMRMISRQKVTEALDQAGPEASSSHGLSSYDSEFPSMLKPVGLVPSAPCSQEAPDGYVPALSPGSVQTPYPVYTELGVVLATPQGSEGPPPQGRRDI